MMQLLQVYPPLLINVMKTGKPQPLTSVWPLGMKPQSTHSCQQALQQGQEPGVSANAAHKHATVHAATRPSSAALVDTSGKNVRQQNLPQQLSL